MTSRVIVSPTAATIAASSERGGIFLLRFQTECDDPACTQEHDCIVVLTKAAAEAFLTEFNGMAAKLSSELAELRAEMH